MARVRLLMALSGGATLLGIAVVLGVIGYRVSRSGGSGEPVATTVRLPPGSRYLVKVLDARKQYVNI